MFLKKGGTGYSDATNDLKVVGSYIFITSTVTPNMMS